MPNRPIGVLLVEDNPGDAILIRRMLSGMKGEFDVMHVSSLLEALQCLQKESFDVILLDLGLPDSAGLDTLTRVRGQVPNVTIIVTTGLSEREIAVLALSGGAQDFFAKERIDARSLSRSIFRWTQQGN